MSYFSRGVFTISIDYEYAWGYADRVLSPLELARIRKEKEITERLLRLCETYQIPVTWAIVSHLLHPRKDVVDVQDVAWFDAAGLISTIQKNSVEHEIGSHSYAHILYGDKKTTKQDVRRDLFSAQEIHKKNNLPFESFVFPRNNEGYHDELFAHGIKIYRGTTLRWYMKFPTVVRRFLRVIDYYLPYVPVVWPVRTPTGLVCIPDSLLFLSRKGFRKIIHPFCMRRKLHCGLRRAVVQKGIFHLWFHPSNFSYDTETQFRIFEAILKEAADLRKSGLLDVLTMKKIYAILQ